MAYEQLTALLTTAETRLTRREATMTLLLADAGLRPGDLLAVL